MRILTFSMKSDHYRNKPSLESLYAWFQRQFSFYISSSSSILYLQLSQAEGSLRESPLKFHRQHTITLLSPLMYSIIFFITVWSWCFLHFVFTSGFTLIIVSLPHPMLDILPGSGRMIHMRSNYDGTSICESTSTFSLVYLTVSWACARVWYTCHI